MRRNVSDFNRTTNPSVLLQQLINIGIYQTHYGIAQVQFVGSISPIDIQFEKRGARLKSIVWHRIECKPLPPPLPTFDENERILLGIVYYARSTRLHSVPRIIA